MKNGFGKFNDPSYELLGMLSNNKHLCENVNDVRQWKR